MEKGRFTNSLETLAEATYTSSTVLLGSNVVMNLLFSASLNLMWSMVDS